MSRSSLNLLVTARVLHHIQDDSFDVVDISPNLRNVCAKLRPELDDQISNLCGVLGISKRSFIEAALKDACDIAKSIIEQEGGWESLGVKA